ncbi:hypothetical protein D3C75_795920 [compost metagenome]
MQWFMVADVSNLPTAAKSICHYLCISWNGVQMRLELLNTDSFCYWGTLAVVTIRPCYPTATGLNYLPGAAQLLKQSLLRPHSST